MLQPRGAMAPSARSSAATSTDDVRRIVARYMGFGTIALAFLVGAVLVRIEEIVSSTWFGEASP